ncbi:hypothetical protein ACH41H_49485 [Streptomyces sp. NPDC020800]|uniref:hypothetical protein n=1 Tax=Streptomyces sp. NPDC020800 TaxID=3365092 RepID=UPI0037940D4F
MSDPQAEEDRLHARYSAQVAADLERTAAEMKRLTSEVTVLTNRRQALIREHMMLVRLQESLQPGASAADDRDEAAAPSGTKKSSPASAPQTATGDNSARAARQTPKKSAPTSQANTVTSMTRPVLVGRIREQLGVQVGPRSVGEITSALSKEHPELHLKTAGVRKILQAMVVEGLAERVVKDKSVFYSMSAPFHNSSLPSMVPTDMAG